MKDIRLVALDLDGTVFNDKKEITPRTLAAIRSSLCTWRGGAARHRAYSQRHPRGVHVHPRRAVRADLQRSPASLT